MNLIKYFNQLFDNKESQPVSSKNIPYQKDE